MRVKKRKMQRGRKDRLSLLGVLLRFAIILQVKTGNEQICQYVLGFRRKQLSSDVWHNTTLGDDDIAKQFVQPNDHNHQYTYTEVNLSWTYSSSFRMASWRWRGTIRCFLLSRAAFPASSRISAARYSRTAAR